jgi:hypothetical protein
MMIGRRVLVLMSLGLWVWTFAGGPAGAADVEGFRIRARAAGATVEFNQPGSPIPAQPTGEFHQAFSDSQHETGPTGHGLASALWPGSTAANAGSFFGGPNYPVRAEAFHPAGPPEQKENEEGGQFVMEAHSNETETGAAATTQSIPGGPAVQTGSLRSTTTSAVEGDMTVATATAAATDIVLGGVVHIESVVTKAKATSDGVKGTVEGKTVVKGVTVSTSGGEVSGEGITIGGQPLPVPVDPAPIENALTQAGITMKVARPVDKTEGADASRTMGGLVVTFAPGTAGAPVPTSVTYHFAAVSVSAAATAPLDETTFDVPPAETPPTTETTGGTTTGSTAPAAPPAGAPFEDTPVTAPAEIATQPVSGEVPLPVAAVPVVLGVIAGIGSAVGGKLFGSLATGALADSAGPACPFGKQ